MAWRIDDLSLRPKRGLYSLEKRRCILFIGRPRQIKAHIRLNLGRIFRRSRDLPIVVGRYVVRTVPYLKFFLVEFELARKDLGGLSPGAEPALVHQDAVVLAAKSRLWDHFDVIKRWSRLRESADASL